MAEKSLDDRIKEAELAIKEAELEKLKAETALARKQLNAKWYSGKSLAQITALVLTVVAVYTAIDKIFLSELKQKEGRLAKVETALFQAQVDSLNRKKTRTITTIDSLVLDGAGFSLLGSAAVLDSALKQYRMIKKKGYFDSRLNKTGKGTANKYEEKVVKGKAVIYDAATKLTWQGGNEFPGMVWENAKVYVDTLTYAGFDDWRLPTLEEAMSLMEPEENGRFVDLLFNDTSWIWTANKYSASRAWFVYFVDGYCSNGDIVGGSNFVRAVR